MVAPIRQSEEIDMPIIQIGKGKPAVAVLCGIHGDEKTPFLIAEQLTKIKPDKGSVHIFLGVNQQAIQLGKRFVDTDLNRVFPGKSDGNLEERIAHKLVKLLEDMDAVIDLHTFGMESPVTALQFTEECPLVDAFMPEQVWMLIPEKGNEFVSALGPWLAKQGKPNIAVEMNLINHFEDLDKVLEGFRNIFKHLGMLTEKPKKNGAVPKFIRTPIKTDHPGIFVPAKNIKDNVKQGDLIGHVFSIKDLSKNEIIAPKTGIIMQIRRKEKVKMGDDVFAIGEQK